MASADDPTLSTRAADRCPPRLLVLTNYYYPATAAGGPPRSVRSALLASRTVLPVVICRDHDHLSGDRFPSPYRGRAVVDGIDVHYLSDGLRSLIRWLATLTAELRRADVVWLNSLHSMRFTVLPLVVRSLAARTTPLMISTRGELAPTALARHRLRKAMWQAVLRISGITRSALWLASGPNEKADVVGNLPHVKVFTMPERSLMAEEELRFKDLGSPLKLVFLGRIAPIKGLDDGLRILAKVRRPVHLTIAGATEDREYRDLLTTLERELPGHVTVDWVGSLDADQIAHTIRRHDALFLPTRGESFGHAIAETLALGRPVFVPLNTPWSFAAEHGALIPLDRHAHAASAERIDTYASLPDDAVRHVQEAARRIGLAGIPGDGFLDDAAARVLDFSGGGS